MARARRYDRESGEVKRDPRKISEVLTDLMARRGYGQVQASDDCQQAWTKVVGQMAKFTHAGDIKRGILHVVASNSVVIQELTFRKTELIAAMARELPHHQIKDLRFRQGVIR
jgi:predicted nucleic acid-binding Zn ribbon protein